MLPCLGQWSLRRRATGTVSCSRLQGTKLCSRQDTDSVVLFDALTCTW